MRENTEFQRDGVEVDGCRIPTVQNPADEEQLSQILADACAAGSSIIPVGGATHLHWGNPPQGADLAVRLDSLNNIIAHEANDLLVTVQAGCPFNRLQAVLAKRNQWIPIDAAVPDTATIGGLAAVNLYGPSRLRYGKLRDYILGMRVVHADGTRTKAGGRVVKNVAGYDLSRMYIGSLGWLGLFTEFHFKTVPLPDCEKTGSVRSSNLELLKTLSQKVLDAALEPTAMVLTTTATLTTAHDHHAEALQEFVLLIKFTGHPETADWQWSRFCELANSLNLAGIEPLAADRNAEIWQSVGGMALAREDPQQVMLKIIAPHRLTVSLTEEIARKAMNLSLVMRWISYAGAHVLWIALYPAAGAGLPVEPLAAWLESLRRQLRNDRGELIVAHAPRQLKDMLEVWGVEGKPLELMQGIKRQLDPKGILNPGRFVGRM